MAISIMHSTPAFKDKMRWAGIADEHQNVLLTKYKSLQQFAQSCGINPDHVEDERLLKKVVTSKYRLEGASEDVYLWKPNESEPDPIEPQICLQIRTLFWEAFHMMAVDTRHRHDSYNADGAARPIHNLEREDRRDAIKAALHTIMGIYEGRWEPAHCIEDDTGAMVTRDRLDRYISPAD